MKPHNRNKNANVENPMDCPLESNGDWCVRAIIHCLPCPVLSLSIVSLFVSLFPWFLCNATGEKDDDGTNVGTKDSCSKDDLLALVRAIKFAKPDASMRSVHWEIGQELSQKVGFAFGKAFS